MGQRGKACSDSSLHSSAFEDKDSPFLPFQGGCFLLEGLLTCFREEGVGQKVFIPAASGTPSV